MLGQRFNETYRIYMDNHFKQWRVEVGTPECLFLYEPQSAWFSTEQDAQSAALLVKEILNLADRLESSFEFSLVTSNGNIELEQVNEAWSEALTDAREVEQREDTPSFIGDDGEDDTDDDDNPF